MNTQKSKHTVLYKSLLMLILVLLAYAANYWLNIVLARLLPATMYGDFSVIKEIMLLASIVLLLGSNFSVLKFVPEYKKAEQYGLMKGYLLHNWRLFWIMSITLFILAVVLLFFKAIPFWLIILTILFAGMSYLAELLRAFNKVFYGSFISDLLTPILLTLALLLLLPKTLIPTLTLYALALIITIFLAVIFTWKFLPKSLFHIKAQQDKPAWNSCSRNLMLSKFVLTLLFSSEIIILKIFGHKPAEVGIFAAILTVGALYWVIFNGVNYVISPLISPLVYAKDKLKLRSIFKTFTILLFILITVLSSILIYYRIPILRYFNPAFIKGAFSYTIILLGFAITVILGLPWFFIGLSGHHHLLVRPVFVVAITSIIYTAILTHFFNLLGAAIGLALTDTIMGIWLTIILYKLNLLGHHHAKDI